MRALAAGLLAMLMAAGVQAQEEETLYGGCTDARGGKVMTLRTPGLQAVVALSVEGGQAVIRYDDQALPRLLPESRLFLFARTCARLNLGFPARGELDETQARRADCAGLAMLRRAGQLGSVTPAALEADLRLSDAESAWLPGPRRAITFAGCADPQPRGNLAVRDEGERSGWNACIRACAAPLYQCQSRCAAGACGECESRYQACSRGCEAQR